MKKLASILLVVCTIFISFTTVCFAEGNMCGDNTTWTFNDGVLTISGTGPTWDWSVTRVVRGNWVNPKNSTPWASVISEIKKVIIDEGVTFIGGDAFVEGSGITEVVFPNTLETIDSYAFSDCNINSVQLPVSLKEVSYAGLFGVKEVHYLGTKDQYDKIKKGVNCGLDKAVVTFDGTSANSNQIHVLINNKILICDQPPVLQNDRTLVPLRAIFEALGAAVDWNSETQTVTATKDDIVLSLTIGSSIIYVNDSPVSLDVPAQIINGRTLVPVRAIAESLDCTVSWNGLFKYVIITIGNQKPYRIEATDKNGNFVGTAYFNDKGQLIKTVYTKAELVGDDVNTRSDLGHDWFLPFYANINGNTYSTHGYELEFIYDEKGNVSKLKESAIEWTISMGELERYESVDYIDNYEYDSNNLICKITSTNSSDDSDLDITDIEYIGNRETEIKRKVKNESDSYVYTSFGLIRQINSGWDTDNYSYDENYNLTACNGSIYYNYDENGKLVSASDSNRTVTYRYVYE